VGSGLVAEKAHDPAGTVVDVVDEVDDVEDVVVDDVDEVVDEVDDVVDVVGRRAGLALPNVSRMALHRAVPAAGGPHTGTGTPPDGGRWSAEAPPPVGAWAPAGEVAWIKVNASIATPPTVAMKVRARRREP
jgi:hypothetical protein